MATNPAAPNCPGIVVLDNLTCGNCGRAVAQYPDHRDPERLMRWEHRRGAVIGTTHRLRSDAYGAEQRAIRAETRIRELEADVLALEDRLVTVGADAMVRIEAKLDTLLSRPAVMEWRPDHRRRADGGERVDDQRKRAGVRLARAARE